MPTERIRKMNRWIRRGLWWVHRALCFVKVHAADRVWMYDDESDDFKPDGWFCGVCNKTWEERR